jgi:hypothetical protein
MLLLAGARVTAAGAIVVCPDSTILLLTNAIVFDVTGTPVIVPLVVTDDIVNEPKSLNVLSVVSSVIFPDESNIWRPYSPEVATPTVVLVNTSDTPPIVSVVLVAVLLLAELVCRTDTVCPFVTVPLAEVYAPPSILYVPLLIDIDVAVFTPDTVIALDVTVELKATSFWSAKIKASGVVSGAAATVVLVNTSDTPPIVSVVLVAVLLLAELVCRTDTVCPFVTVPLAEVYAPPFILYVPPDTDIDAAAFIPDTLMLLEVITVFRDTFVWSVKVN